METFIIPFVIFSVAGAAFCAGKLHERIECNKLIQAGILPKPRGK